MEVNIMPMNQGIQQCRDHCDKLANQIRTIANSTTDQRSREMLTLGASHLEMCIHTCDELLMMP
jgi:hypothetical protein